MNMPLRALLVDDEAPALQRLKQLLVDHGGVDVLGLAGSVDEAIAQLERHPVDLVFLDLRMPGAEGSSLLPHLPKHVDVIFTTAHSDYAVSAFEAGVHDYLLKPINSARLALSLERLQQLRESSQLTTSTDPAAGFWIDDSDRSDGSLQFVAFRDLLWVEAQQNYTHLRLCGCPALILKRTMKQWENLLPQDRFVRLDRSTIVQVRLIERCERQSRAFTLLRFGADPTAPALAVGPTAAARLHQVLTQRTG